MTTTEEEELENEILIGTYEDYVVGYRVESFCGKKKKASQPSTTNGITSSKQYSLEQSFAVRGHSGSVRCLAASEDGSLAVSAGFDEMINLFSLKKRKLLQTFEGAVNCAAFVGKSHLICGLEDGNIFIYELKGSTINLVKTLKGHTMAITSLSVHPSGKVMLTLSKDNTMRTWNLIKGRCAYVTNIYQQAHLVRWSKSGNEFIIAANNEIYLYNNSTGNLEHSLKLDKRINSIEFITNNIFMVASDSGTLDFYDLKEGVSLMKHEAHEVRVKSIRCLTNIKDDEETIAKLCQFATASSDGIVKLWSINIDRHDKSGRTSLGKPQELTDMSTGTRLTCMTSLTHNHQ